MLKLEMDQHGTVSSLRLSSLRLALSSEDLHRSWTPSSQNKGHHSIPNYTTMFNIQNWKTLNSHSNTNNYSLLACCTLHQTILPYKTWMLENANASNTLGSYDFLSWNPYFNRLRTDNWMTVKSFNLKWFSADVSCCCVKQCYLQLYLWNILISAEFTNLIYWTSSII